MTDSNEEELLRKRFLEMARKTSSCGYYMFSDFLSLAEQSVFYSVKSSLPKGSSYTVFGGAEGCERVMIRFGDEEEIGYSEPFPISLIKVAPRAPKFAEKLSHRDFLGALMNLGIERSCLGDIVIINNEGYIFAKENMATYICDSLTKIRRTDVTLSLCDVIPEGELFKTETARIQLSGERIDAAVAKVFSISRDDSLSLFKKGLVFVFGKECENNSYTPKAGDLISVRGYGRFIYKGAVGTSKKGKLNVEIEKYV